MIQPNWNKETGFYEVIMYGQINEFESWEGAWDYINQVMDDYYNDPVWCCGG